MTTTMPKWASRALALTILLVILWLVFVLAVNPIVSAYRTTGDELDRTVEQLARYQNVSKAYPKLKQQMDVLSRRHAASGVYLAGTTDALAAAELQEDVGQTIEANGGALRSIQILPTSADGEFRKVTVRVQLTANLPSLARILYSLEAAKPFVFIDNLDIKNRRVRRTAKEQNDNPELVVRFDLFGYLRPELS